jgi:uncharacterized membrane protein YqaE (UPF0057 family)
MGFFFFSNLSTYITLELEHIVASYLGANNPAPVEPYELLLCFDPLVGCVCVCVFFPLATFVHFSRASSLRISLLLFCFVVSFRENLSSDFCPRTFAKMTDGPKGTYTFIDVLLAIILPPLGVFFKYGCEVCTYVCMYVCLVVIVVFLLLHHHHQLWNFNLSLNLLFCFVLFRFFLSFNIWSMVVDMIMSCQRILLVG